MIPFEKLVKALNIYNGIETPELQEEPVQLVQEEEFMEVESGEDFFEEEDFPQESASSANEPPVDNDLAALEDGGFGDLEDSEFSPEVTDNEIDLVDDFQEVSNENDSFSGGFDILEEEPVEQKAPIQDNQDDKIDILGHEDFPAVEQPMENDIQLPDDSIDSDNEPENILADSFGQDEAAFDILEEQPASIPEEQGGVPVSPEQQQGSQPISEPFDSGEFPPPPEEQGGVPAPPEQQQGSQPISEPFDSGEFPPPPEEQGGIPAPPEQQQGSQPVSEPFDSGEFPPPPKDQQ